MPQEFIVIHKTPGGEKLLRKPAKKVSFPLSNSLLHLIEEMKISIIEADGIGLAATQVGYPLQLIVYYVPKDILTFRHDAYEDVPMSVLINGSYTPVTEEGMFSDWEGCFSVDNYMAKVPRYKSILYSGQNLEGQPVTGIARGLLARILQHEIDHTKGILFIDHLTKHCIQGPEEEMMKIRKLEYDERKLKRELSKAAHNNESETEKMNTIKRNKEKNNKEKKTTKLKKNK